jgi:hypothetical protein
MAVGIRSPDLDIEDTSLALKNKKQKTCIEVEINPYSVSFAEITA